MKLSGVLRTLYHPTVSTNMRSPYTLTTQYNTAAGKCMCIWLRHSNVSTTMKIPCRFTTHPESQEWSYRAGCQRCITQPCPQRWRYNAYLLHPSHYTHEAIIRAANAVLHNRAHKAANPMRTNSTHSIPRMMFLSTTFVQMFSNIRRGSTKKLWSHL